MGKLGKCLPRFHAGLGTRGRVSSRACWAARPFPPSPEELALGSPRWWKRVCGCQGLTDQALLSAGNG